LVHVIPGDPALVMLGGEGTPQQVTELRKQLGLDRPLPIRYWEWLSRVARGDLGESLYNRTRVVDELIWRFPTTLALITALWSGPGRTKSIALWSGLGGAISALGPLLSGLLLEHFWWGSVFLVTLPLAVVALLMALAFVLGIGLGGTQPFIMALLYEKAPEGRGAEVLSVRTWLINFSQTSAPLASGALGAALGMLPVFWAMGAILLIAGLFAARGR